MSKIKFVVETDDFWMGEDSESLDKSLKQYIIREVVNSVMSKVSENIEKEISDIVFKQITESQTTMIESLIQEKSKSLKVKRRYSSEELTVEEAVEKMLTEKGNVNSVVEQHISRLSSDLAKKLKERYDLQFASHIVKNMNENNLLREGVAESLIENKNAKK